MLSKPNIDLQILKTLCKALHKVFYGKHIIMQSNQHHLLKAA
jgi:hypothetical protein